MTAAGELSAIGDRLDRLGEQVGELAVELRTAREDRERWRELAGELTPVAQGAMEVMSRELEDLSRDVTVDDLVRFLRTLLRALPRLEATLTQLDSVAELTSEITSLTGDGVAKLSDTLATAERRGYFGAARAAATTTDRAVRALVTEGLPDSPPSLPALLRQLRDPRVRLALARLLTVLRVLGDPGPDPTTSAGPSGSPISHPAPHSPVSHPAPKEAT